MTGPLEFQRPTLPAAKAIERYLALSRQAGWFSNFGPCWELLRARLGEAVGRPCVPVSSATVGLMSAIAVLRSRGPGGGREALMPSFAFPASAQAAVWNGLQPVFVDVAPDHWHLDPAALDTALDARRGRVAIVVALSSLGVPPPPEVRTSWEAACASAGVPLIVDSAAGYGARASDGVRIGAQGDVEVVSFDAVKPLSAGEGGAVFCKDEAVADEIRQLAHFAIDEHRQVTRPDGLNAKMSEPAAAIALASLDELEASLEIRRTLATELLAVLPEGFERQAGSARGTWQFVPVTAPDSATREAVLEEAGRRQILTRTYYDPLHLMPAFADSARAGDLAVTEDIGGRMLSLPMALDLDAGEIAAIGDMCQAAVSLAQVG